MRALALLFLALFVGSWPEVAQDPGQASALPVSRERVLLQLLTEDGVEGRVTVLNGAMIRLEDDSGVRIGLVPLPKGPTLDVLIASISRRVMTRPALRPCDSLGGLRCHSVSP